MYGGRRHGRRDRALRAAAAERQYDDGEDHRSHRPLPSISHRHPDPSLSLISRPIALIGPRPIALTGARPIALTGAFAVYRATGAFTEAAIGMSSLIRGSLTLSWTPVPVFSSQAMSFPPLGWSPTTAGRPRTVIWRGSVSWTPPRKVGQSTAALPCWPWAST